MEIFGISFVSPYWFWGLILVVVIGIGVFKKPNSQTFAFFLDIKKVYRKHSFFFYTKQIILICILVVIILCLSKPYSSYHKETIKQNWIDISMVMDVSMSMEAMDLEPNRMEQAKDFLSKMVEQIKTDRIGLVVFAWKPFVSLPLTFDYQIVKDSVKEISTSTINQYVPWMSSTAIGDAIISSIQQLSWTKTENINREKIIILLTDWEANVWIDPVLSAKLAKEKWIKIYTIWIWSEDGWYILQETFWWSKKIPIAWVDEENLKKISEISWWIYFRAKDNKTFEKILSEISKITKTEIEYENIIIYKSVIEYFVLILGILVFIYTMLYYLDE